MSPAELLASLSRALQSLSTVDVDEAMRAFCDLESAQERLEIRAAFLAGALEIVVQAGGLRLDRTDIDAEGGWPTPPSGSTLLLRN